MLLMLSSSVGVAKPRLSGRRGALDLLDKNRYHERRVGGSFPAAGPSHTCYTAIAMYSLSISLLLQALIGKSS